MYVITIIERTALPDNKPVKHHINFKSMAELKSWVERNHYYLGKARVDAPIFSIEHADGSSISEAEKNRILKFASQDAWISRQRKAPFMSQRGNWQTFPRTVRS
jgi:hypothetical protein